jgi:hypothetical protein
LFSKRPLPNIAAETAQNLVIFHWVKGGEIMVLELDERELETVKHALETFEEELRSIRVRTDKKEAKAELHTEEDVAKRILERIGGEKTFDAVERYCNNLSTELGEWKRKVSDVVSKLDRVPTGYKEKLVDELNELHIVIEELAVRTEKLRTQCATSWEPEREQIEKKAGWLRQRVVEVAETIPQSDIGG